MAVRANFGSGAAWVWPLQSRRKPGADAGFGQRHSCATSLASWTHDRAGRRKKTKRTWWGRQTRARSLTRTHARTHTPPPSPPPPSSPRCLVFPQPQPLLPDRNCWASSSSLSRSRMRGLLLALPRRTSLFSSLFSLLLTLSLTSLPSSEIPHHACLRSR